MPNKHSLLFFRNQINSIDKNIVQLLAERKNLVLKIAQSKIENKIAIRDLEREKKMLNKLTMLAKENNLQPEYITQLFQLIIQESVLTQQKLLQKSCKNNHLTYPIFSVLGPEGSYSYIAAYEYANRNFQKYTINEYSTFKKVILSVETKQSDYAILPIENSSSGLINEVFTLLEQTSLFIVNEINIFINHCILGIEKIALNEIQEIYSHPQPFKQCSNFIKQFPKWKINYTKSTTDAMKIISEYNEKTHAALGSEIGGKIYGLKILYNNVSDEIKNITKFIILRRNPANIVESISNKTVLLLTTNQEENNLSNILSILKEKKIVIKKLISQKLNHNVLKEIFYLEIQVDLTSKLMQNTLEKIKKFAICIKILGCYLYEKTIPIVPRKL